MRPAFKIRADQVDVTAVIRDRLLSMRIEDEPGWKSDRVELYLDDRDGRIARPAKGAVLDVSIGYSETGLTHMGRFTVDEVEISGPPHRIGIFAKAADMRSEMKQPITKSWDGVTIRDLVSTIASSHGLAPAISPALAGKFYNHVDQTEESDLHLLTRLARDLDAIAKPASGRLLFVTRGESKSITGKPLKHAVITPEDLADWRMREADREKYTAVIAHFQDVDGGDRVPVRAGEGSPVYTIRRTYPDQAQAYSAAVARLDALQRGAATLACKGRGRTDLVAEGTAALSGFRDGLDGEWTITRATHVFSGTEAFETSFEAETPKSK